MDIEGLLSIGRDMNASDLHFTVGLPPIVRVDGKLRPLSDFPPCTDTYIKSVVEVITHDIYKKQLAEGKDADFTYVSKNGHRHRVNVYRQKNHPAVALRFLRTTIPTLDELRLPPVLGEFSLRPRGLVLVTGPTGSGKSTTLAAMINHINTNLNQHIIIVEDPIEYLHTHNRSMISQREVGKDVESFSYALRSALREDPDVILVGEMRDFDTISAAITAAETGHLVMSTLHTTDAPSTIDRIIDVFPPHQQQQIRVQLASVLVGIASQQLIPRADGNGRVAVVEVLSVTDSVAALIRDNKVHQIHNAILSGRSYGMQTRDQELARFVNRGIITPQEAFQRCSSPEELNRFLNSTTVI